MMVPSQIGAAAPWPIFKQHGEDHVLTVDNIIVKYGSVTALRDVSLEVGSAESVALIGANGAGKSTLLKSIIGLLPLHAGALTFDQTSLGRLPPDRRIRLGIGYAPEGRRVFPGLTVRENLEVAIRVGAGQRRAMLDFALAMFPDLGGRQDARGWQLSGGQQQVLAIARALMGRPKLLLLDEPSLGLSPKLVDEVLRQIPMIVQRGTSVLLAEQNVA